MVVTYELRYREDNFVDNEIAFALDLVEKMKSIASSL